MYSPCPITTVSFTSENISLLFEDKSILKFRAVGGCCSSSTLHLPDNAILSNIIGKSLFSLPCIGKIKIDKMNNYTSLKNIIIPLAYNYDDKSFGPETILFNCYKFIFFDGSSFEFILMNKSNGYYNGWLEVEQYTRSGISYTKENTWAFYPEYKADLAYDSCYDKIKKYFHKKIIGEAEKVKTIETIKNKPSETTLNTKTYVKIILGLPYSGKTTYMKSLCIHDEDGDVIMQNEYETYDDVLSNLTDGQFIRAINCNKPYNPHNPLYALVTDPRLCDPIVFTNFIKIVLQYVPKDNIELILFENDPDACIKNYLRDELPNVNDKNEDNLDNEKRNILEFIEIYKNIYDVNHRAYNHFKKTVIKVWT